jgi:hypothetical protein
MLIHGQDQARVPPEYSKMHKVSGTVWYYLIEARLFGGISELGLICMKYNYVGRLPEQMQATLSSAHIPVVPGAPESAGNN